MAGSTSDDLADAISNVAINGDIVQADDMRGRLKKPFSAVIKLNHKAHDITTRFNECAEALAEDELIQDASFSLFDSVQALEIGDPKMDSGFLRDGDELDIDFDAGACISPEEVVATMDKLLCYEMAWHRGYPLAQTLFTSLHLDLLLTTEIAPGHCPQFPASHSQPSKYPPELVHLVLRAYCIGVIKSIDIAIEMITSKLYYEEEDFCTNTYNRSLLTDYPDQDCLELLKEARDWILEADLSLELSQALSDRLQARIAFMAPFAQIVDPPAPTAYMIHLCDLAKRIQSTGQPDVPAIGFSMKMQRRLATTVPPRAPIELTLFDACGDLQYLATHVMEAFEVSQFDSIPSAQCLRAFLMGFGAKIPTPSPFSRAFLQHVMLEGRVAGQGAITQLAVYALNETAFIDNRLLTSKTEKDPRQSGAQLIDHFIKVSSDYLLKLLPALCQNRCRVRRCLLNVLQDLSASNSEPEATLKQQQNFVETFSGIPLQLLNLQWQGWHVRECNQLAQLFVLSGFELDLYQYSELGLNYWLASCWSTALKQQTAILLESYESQIRRRLDVGLGADEPNNQYETDLCKEALQAACGYDSAVAHLCESLSMTYLLLTRLDMVAELPSTAFSFRTESFLTITCLKTPDTRSWSTWQKRNRSVLHDVKPKIEECLAVHVLPPLKSYRALAPYTKWAVGAESATNEHIEKIMKSVIELRLFLTRLHDAVNKDSLSDCKLVIPERLDRRHPWFVIPKIIAK